MPRIQWKLSAREQVEHISRAERLRAIGVDIEVPKLASRVPECGFEIGYELFPSVIFNWSTSHDTIIATGVRIVPRRSGVYLTDEVEVTLPWDGLRFDLWCWDDKRDRIALGLPYNKDEVLNCRLEHGIKLQRGKVLTGVLVLVAYDEQLPKEYRHRERISLRVSLFDTLGNKFVAKGKVQVDREKGVRRSRPHKGNPSEDLAFADVQISESLKEGPAPPFPISEESRLQCLTSSKTDPSRKLASNAIGNDSTPEQLNQMPANSGSATGRAR